MKALTYLIFIICFISCNKKSINKEKDNLYYPEDFINPSTQINTEISKETDEIIEYITNYTTFTQYPLFCGAVNNNCAEKKHITNRVKFFFNFDDTKRLFTVKNDYDYSCLCDENRVIKESFTIDLTQIASVSTLKPLITKDIFNNDLTYLMIKPKYNNKSVEYKKIIQEDSQEETTYFTQEYNTESDILIYLHTKTALTIKKELEKLILLFNPNYALSDILVEETYNPRNESTKILQDFTYEQLSDSPLYIREHGCGCFYSASMKDYDEGIYYYVDDYNKLSYIKFNNQIYKFTFIDADIKNATRKGFVKAKHTDTYTLDIGTTPHFNDSNKYLYTEVNLKVNNIKTGKSTQMTLFGHCGC